MYSKKVLRHFRSPRNVGEIKNPDGVGIVGNPVCGDVMKITLRISKKKGHCYIKDIRFQTFGCVAAIATCSVLTELVKGKTVKEAERIEMSDIISMLDCLPEHKMHCARLAVDALKKALASIKNEA